VFAERIAERIRRQKAFFRSKRTGDMLLCRESTIPNFEMHWVKRLMETDVVDLLDEGIVDRVNDEYLEEMRGNLANLLRYDDDAVPTPEIYFAIGSITSAMCGAKARYASDTAWCEPVLDDWADLPGLRFDPDSPWLRFHVMVYRDLARKWEGDYLLLPYLHRSPLDAANGIRGNELFTDFYEHPEMAKRLIDWCADWSIAVEKHLWEELALPGAVGRGAWSVVLPDDAVFVNGDPVDLISGEQQVEFELPYTEKLFTSRGGGFHHHHALGIRQVRNVSRIKGLLVQNIITDPGVPAPADLLVADERVRREVIEASMVAPIHLNGDFTHDLDRLLDVLTQGRFILRHHGDDDASGAVTEAVNKARNNL
jgi:hypothetical protein